MPDDLHEVEPKTNKPPQCMGCPLYDSPYARDMVWGEGPTQGVKIMIVGEAPGEDEQRLLRPFIGGSGRILNVQLRQAGIDRRDVYVTNVVKCRPVAVVSNGRLENRKPSEDEIRHCTRYLAQELDTVRPNVVLALGETPLYALTGRSRIGQQRGVPLSAPRGDGRVQKILATYHPAYIMRSQEMWPIAVHDMSKAQREGETAEIVRAEVRLVRDAKPEVEGLDLLNRARTLSIVNIDIETMGYGRGYEGALDPKRSQLVCWGAATGPDLGECYHYNPASATLLRTLLEDPAIEKEGQNSEQFDWVYLEGTTPPDGRGPFRVVGRTFDTMQAAHLLNSSLPKDLGFLMTLYTDMEYHKNEARKDLFGYNAKDTVGARRIGIEQREELRYYDMEYLYYNIVQPVQRPLRRMTRVGWKKDVRRAAGYSILFTQKAEEYLRKLRAVFGEDINFDSPKQLMNILYTKLDLPVQYVKDPRTKELKPTCNAAALDKLAEITDDPIFSIIHKMRSVNKARETFIDVEEDENGYVHPEFGTSTAANGRLNSWSPNGQNIPLDYRDIYIPDSPEHVLIAADWSQVEWAAAMAITGDPVGLELISTGADGHTITAAECFGYTVDQVRELDAKHSGTWGSPRFEAKFIVYGLGYGRGAKDIAKQLKREVQWVEGFIRRFASKYKVYWKARDEWERFVAKNAYLRNPWGRRRWWFSRQVTEMYNFLPSSIPADMMMQVIPACEADLPKGARLWATIHDDLTICAPKDVAREAFHCLRTHMCRTWDTVVEASNFPDVVKQYYPNGWYVKTDVHIGNTWKECKKGNKDLERSLL